MHLDLPSMAKDLHRHITIAFFVPVFFLQTRASVWAKMSAYEKKQKTSDSPCRGQNDNNNRKEKKKKRDRWDFWKNLEIYLFFFQNGILVGVAYVYRTSPSGTQKANVMLLYTYPTDPVWDSKNKSGLSFFSSSFLRLPLGSTYWSIMLNCMRLLACYILLASHSKNDVKKRPKCEGMINPQSLRIHSRSSHEKGCQITTTEHTVVIRTKYAITRGP